MASSTTAAGNLPPISAVKSSPGTTTTKDFAASPLLRSPTFSVASPYSGVTTTTTTLPPPPPFFSLILAGQLESAHFPQYDMLYAKFAFHHGPDWSIVFGVEEGITQMSKATQPSVFASSAGNLQHPAASKINIWNLPLDIGFKSTNFYGWPELIISVYGLDIFGRDVIRGYGTVKIPVKTGQHTLYVPIFTPLASTPFNQFLSWATGRLPEFVDPKFVLKNHARHITRVRSQGTVKIKLTVMTKGISEFGYTIRPSDGE